MPAQAAKDKKAASVAQSQREREPYASGKRLHRARAVPQGVLVASTGAAKVSENNVGVKVQSRDASLLEGFGIYRR